MPVDGSSPDAHRFNNGFGDSIRFRDGTHYEIEISNEQGDNTRESKRVAVDVTVDGVDCRLSPLLMRRNNTRRITGFQLSRDRTESVAKDGTRRYDMESEESPFIARRPETAQGSTREQDEQIGEVVFHFYGVKFVTCKPGIRGHHRSRPVPRTHVNAREGVLRTHVGEEVVSRSGTHASRLRKPMLDNQDYRGSFKITICDRDSTAVIPSLLDVSTAINAAGGADHQLTVCDPGSVLFKVVPRHICRCTGS